MGSSRGTETDVAITIWPTLRERILLLGISALLVVGAALGLALVDAPLARLVGVIAGLMAIVTIPVAALQATRRLEYKQGKIALVGLGRRVECPVQEIAAIELQPLDKETSFAVLKRHDGTRAFPKRQAWPTLELQNLASRLGIPIDAQSQAPRHGL